MSGIDTLYHEHARTYTGDDVDYERQLGRMRAKGFNGQSDVVTKQYCTIKTYNLAEEQELFHQFQHIRGGYEFYYNPQHLNLLQGKISCNGTFHCIKDITRIKQLYCITAQLYNDNCTQTHCQPILSVLLPNSTTATYNAVWMEIKTIFREKYNEELSPVAIHSDNEQAFLKSVRLQFPYTRLVTCLFHIKQCFRRHLTDLKINPENKDTSYYIGSCYKTISGLLFMDLSNHYQLESSINLLQQMGE